MSAAITRSRKTSAIAIIAAATPATDHRPHKATGLLRRGQSAPRECPGLGVSLAAKVSRPPAPDQLARTPAFRCARTPHPPLHPRQNPPTRPAHDLFRPCVRISLRLHGLADLVRLPLPRELHVALRHRHRADGPDERPPRCRPV